MGALVTGLILFFALHSLAIFNEPWRDRIAARFGEGPWKGLYSLISLTGFTLMAWGYGTARHESAAVYLPAPWLTHLVMLLLLPMFPLLLAAYFPGRIKALVKHPMLIATILWAFAHLLVNGRLVDLLLFGSFLAWAVLDLLSMHRRAQRPIPGAPEMRINDLIAMITGFALYGVFVAWLHELLIGVPLVG